MEVQAGFHVRFLRGLAGWLAPLQWSVSTLGEDGEECWKISWLELFWQWVSDTGSLPPVLVDGRWVDSLDAPDVVWCLPGVLVLFATWRRGVRCCGVFCRDGAMLLGWVAFSRESSA